jgi:energy-coupling factor transport system ATP-binding protein
VIRCEALGFTYPDGTPALHGLNLDISAGERFAIVGPNGSGKTTLVRHWNGLLRATTGRVVLDGTPVGTRPVAELARTVGITFQDPTRQLFRGSCHEEVAFGPRNVGLRGRALEAAVDQALAGVGLADAQNTAPYELGPSRRRLLALASVVAMGTPVLVLDEPTIGLDSRQRATVEALVGRLSGDGRTVVAISHDTAFVAACFERVVRLDAGRVVADTAGGSSTEGEARR